MEENKTNKDTVSEHTQVHADGTVHHEHTHAHHEHTHTHDPQEVKKIVNRIAKSVGHLESVKRMVEDGKDCSDVLVQLAAVKGELNAVGKLVLKQHMEHCMLEAVQENDMEAIERMNAAIDQFVK